MEGNPKPLPLFLQLLGKMVATLGRREVEGQSWCELEGLGLQSAFTLVAHSLCLSPVVSTTCEITESSLPPPSPRPLTWVSLGSVHGLASLVLLGRRAQHLLGESVGSGLEGAPLHPPQ